MPNGLSEMPYLVMLRGSQPFRVFPLRKTILTIGRAPNNDIVIMDRRVSRYHARLTYQQGDWILEDLNSDNGVWVNGIRIVGPTYVADDSIISLGQSVNFELELKPDPPPGVPERKFLPGWVRTASLFGIGGMGLIMIGGVLLALLGALAYFAFGFGGGQPWIEVELTGDQPADAAQVAEADQLDTVTGADLAAEFFTVQGPEVTIQEPAPGGTISLGDSFLFQASAYDGEGVVHMELWVDDQLAISQESPSTEGITPFFISHGMIATAEGTYALFVRAYNSLGAVGVSPVIYVTVSGQTKSETFDPLYYSVEEGDTLESIAAATGVSLESLKAANPAVDEVTGPGQIVFIPLPPPSETQPPAQSALQLDGLSPVQGGEPSAAQPDLDPGQIIPELLPSKGENRSFALLPFDGMAPVLLEPFVDNCVVKLTWEYWVDPPDSVAIYRLHNPDQATPTLVARVPSSMTKYTEPITIPGSYTYWIEGMDEPSMIPPNQFFPEEFVAGGGVTAAVLQNSPSQLHTVRVEPQAGCIQNPNSFRLVYFQPTGMTGAGQFNIGPFGLRGTLTQASIWYVTTGSAGRRIPPGERNYYLAGTPVGWPVKPEVLHVPPEVFYSSEPVSFNLYVYALGHTGNTKDTPVDLGETIITYTAYDLKTSLSPQTAADSRDLLRNQVAESGNYNLFYKMWVEDQKWTGQATSASIPAPTNLRVSETTGTYRRLKWDWNGDPKTIDGYVLYRSYICYGQETAVMQPKMIYNGLKESGVMLDHEPAMCSYRYWVSAYGRYGESAPSNTVEGHTQTRYGKATVTFKSIKVNNTPGGTFGGRIVLGVNHWSRYGDRIPLKTPYQSTLDKQTYAGKNPNNQFVMAYGEKETTTVRFSVDKYTGYTMISGGICEGQLTLPPLPAGGSDQSYTRTIKSADGNCEVVVEIGLTPPKDLASGEYVTPQADLKIEYVWKSWPVTHPDQSVYYKSPDYFATIINDGPDTLPANSYDLRAGWRIYDANGKIIEDLSENHPILPHMYKTIWVSDFASRQEIFLDHIILPGSYKLCSGCKAVLRVELYSRNDPDRPGYFVDYNVNNNFYEVDFLEIPTSNLRK